MDHKDPERVKRAWQRLVASRMKADIEADPDSEQADAAEKFLYEWQQLRHRRRPSHETLIRFAQRQSAKAGGFNDATVDVIIEADHATDCWPR